MKLNPTQQFTYNFETIARLLALYGLKPVAVAAATSGIENTTLIVTTITKKVVIRIYRQGKKTTSDVKQEIEFTKYLSNSGVKVANIIPSLKGKELTQFIEHGKTWQVLVMQYLSGEHPATYTGFLLKNMAATQASIHLLADALPKTKQYPSSIPNGFLEKLAMLQPTGELGDFTNRVAQFSLKFAMALPSGLCHLDFDAGNILTDKYGEITAVLDFDDLMLAPLVMCLGFTLWDIQVQANAKMAKQYLKYYSKIRPLSATETLALPSVILFRHYMISSIKIIHGEFTKQSLSKYLKIESELLNQLKQT
jgi:Ser/Thr protein kinase RdoA (MazF antagonist)